MCKRLDVRAGRKPEEDGEQARAHHRLVWAAEVAPDRRQVPAQGRDRLVTTHRQKHTAYDASVPIPTAYPS